MKVERESSGLESTLLAQRGPCKALSRGVDYALSSKVAGTAALIRPRWANEEAQKPGSGRPAIILGASAGRHAEKKQPTMTYRTCQNLLVIGSFLLLAFLIVSPLSERELRVERLPRLETPTVSAATIVEVWVYKKTGLYFCPDSRFYGKVKPGVYMTQEKALEHGFRPAANEPCR
jgi:hypothetical protein